VNTDGGEAATPTSRRPRRPQPHVLFRIKLPQLIHDRLAHQQRNRRHDDQRLDDVGVGRVDLVQAEPRFQFIEQQFDLPARPISRSSIGRAVVVSPEIRQIEMLLLGSLVPQADQSKRPGRAGARPSLALKRERNPDIDFLSVQVVENVLHRLSFEWNTVAPPRA